jgi:acetyltransferase-like isoleucine patch superfamily enzyme
MAKPTSNLDALVRYLATSRDPVATRVRALRRQIQHLEIIPPQPVLKSAVLALRAAREAREFGMRVFVSQPLFRAYCKECGPGLRTGDQIHYIQGDGDIYCGANVWLDGKSNISFAARFADRPTLVIGDNSGFGHDTELVIAKRITIGKNVNISGATRIFDSNGHPADPVARRNHAPPDESDVRPVTIGDDVWIGKDCIVFPGVRIGQGAIVSAGSVVRKHIPPYAVVAGNPAQIVFRLPRPEAAAPGPEVER